MDTQLFLPLKYNQLLELIRQLPMKEKQSLFAYLLKENVRKSDDDATLTHFASENTLAKDWLTDEEDKAWENL